MPAGVFKVRPTGAGNMDEPLFLSPVELIDLTGRKLASAQRRWLTENGYRFSENANGRPIVARKYVLSRLGAAAEESVTAMPGARPNFAALARAA